MFICRKNKIITKNGNFVFFYFCFFDFAQSKYYWLTLISDLDSAYKITLKMYNILFSIINTLFKKNSGDWNNENITKLVYSPNNIF